MNCTSCRGSCIEDYCRGCGRPRALCEAPWTLCVEIGDSRENTGTRPCTHCSGTGNEPICNEGEAFCMAIYLSHQAGEDTSEQRLVFADWLEDRGDPSGASLRIQQQLIAETNEEQREDLRRYLRQQVNCRPVRESFRRGLFYRLRGKPGERLSSREPASAFQDWLLTNREIREDFRGPLLLAYELEYVRWLSLWECLGVM